MAPIAVKTYKGKDKKKRPWANIQNVLSEIKDKEKTESITVFEALFTKNIRGVKSKRTGKYFRNKENNSRVKQLPCKRTVKTKLDINVTSSVQDTFLDSTFDRILVGPVFQQPRPIDVSHKSKEFSTSSISTSGSHCDTSFASDPSYVDNTLFPVTWKTRKKVGVPKSRKILKCVPQKPDTPLQFTEHKKEMLAMHPCVTSTPNEISHRGNYQTSPFLSPILCSVQKGQKSEVMNDITEDKNNSVCGSTSLSRSCVCIFDARKNILPDIHHFDPSFKGSNVSRELLPSSVVEESISKSLGEFVVNKVESCHVPAGAVLSDSVIAIDGACSQLQSCKSDEKIVSAQVSSNKLYGIGCELRKSKEAFMCNDHKSDAAKQLCMNDSTSGVSVSEPHLNLPVHHCVDMNLRREKNRWPKCEGRSLCRNSDGSGEELLGFSAQDSCENPITGGLLGLSDALVELDLCEDSITEVLSPNLHNFGSDNNKCVESNGVTAGVNSTANLPSSKSRNISIVLFDSWDSGNGTKLEAAFERPSENREAVVGDRSQVSESGMPNNYSRTDVSKDRHLHKSSVDIDETDCNYPRDETELLCNNISKEHLSQEPSDTIIGTGKLSSSAKIESTIMTVKMQKSLRRLSSRRLSRRVVPTHKISGPQGKLSFHDMYRNSTCKTASTDLSVALPEEVGKFELLSIAEQSLVSAFSARDAVLQRCHQHAPISFSEAFPTSYWLTCRKVGEGVYGEVFLSDGPEKSVLKVIPIEGEIVVNGEPQKKFEEILSEIVIAMELSGLRNGTENRTGSFSEVKRCLCVQGAYPEKLIDLWDVYDNDKGSENDSPAMFTEDQLYIILVLTHGGYDLEAHIFTNAEQSHSIFIQTGYALAVAEQVLEFEHRDLHWANVLVSQTAEKNVTFKLCGKEYAVPTKGVRVTIIDFTLSRMTYDGSCIYNDLSKDPALFTAEGDYQFEVYRLMQKHTSNSWHLFNPYTNLLWLHYLLDKMCTMVNYLHISSKSHKRGMNMLMKLQEVVLKHRSTQEFILNEVV